MERTTNPIAILGGSGRTGRPLVRAALASGHTVRALARRPEEFPASDKRLVVVRGDAREAPAVIELLEGCDRVIVTLGTRKGERPGYEEAMRVLVDAMHARRIVRCIVLVGLAVHAPTDRPDARAALTRVFMRLLWRAPMEDKQRGADLVMASDLDWTLVRSPFIQVGPSLGPLHSSHAPTPGRPVRAADLAVFLLETAARHDYSRTAPFVCYSPGVRDAGSAPRLSSSRTAPNASGLPSR